MTSVASSGSVRACSIPDCARRAIAHGWCDTHYRYNKKYGDPLGKPARMTDEERFWSKVDKVSSPHGCWLWMPPKTKDGYGRFSVGVQRVPAHRYSWVLAHGPVPDKALQVCHNCPGGDNPACVNPRDLLLLDTDQHGADRAAKGQIPSGAASWSRNHPERVARGDRNGQRLHPERTRRGSNHGRALISESDVRDIRRLRAEGMRLRDIATRYPCTLSTISMITERHTWKHLP